MNERLNTADLSGVQDAQLMELARDAARVVEQRDKLIALNPAKADRYREQAEHAIAEINRQAEEVLRK